MQKCKYHMSTMNKDGVYLFVMDLLSQLLDSPSGLTPYFSILPQIRSSTSHARSSAPVTFQNSLVSSLSPVGKAVVPRRHPCQRQKYTRYLKYGVITLRHMIHFEIVLQPSFTR